MHTCRSFGNCYSLGQLVAFLGADHFAARLRPVKRATLTLVLGSALACQAARAEPTSTPAPEAATSELPAAETSASLIDGAWIQGQSSDLADDPRIVIVEQFATWCEPCVDQLPHLARLQAEHPTDLRVIGISSEAREVVARFVDTHALTHDVVAEATLGYGAAVPYAYVIHAREVVWHGHPSAVDGVVDALLAGTWTEELARLSRELPVLVDDYFDRALAGDAAAAAAIEPLFFEEAVVDPWTQSDIARAILTGLPESSDGNALALRLAERSVARTQRRDWTCLTTLALALAVVGDDQAEAHARDAIAECRAAGEDHCASLERMLRQVIDAREPSRRG